MHMEARFGSKVSTGKERQSTLRYLIPHSRGEKYELRTYQNGLVIGLVGLSMILTWQLWTFQPNIELLDNTAKYVPNEAMSEERKLTEIIRPEQIVIHQQGRHAMIPTNDERFDQLYQKLLKTNFVEGDMLAVGPFPKQVQNGGIELIFPTSIPVDVFVSLFQVDQEEFNLPLSAINRLYMYVDRQDEQVHMQMLSSKDTQVVEVETNFSVGDFERNFLRPFDEYVEVFQANNRSSTRELSEHIYIPVGPLRLKDFLSQLRQYLEHSLDKLFSQTQTPLNIIDNPVV